MNLPALAFGSAAAAFGLLTAAVGMRKPRVDIVRALAELETADVELDQFSEHMSQPFAPRVLRPFGAKLAGTAKGILPNNYMERLRRKLVLAGLGDKLGAEEFLSIQALLAGAAILASLAFGTLRGWTGEGVVKLVVVVEALAVAVPHLVLSHKKELRVQAIRKDLPDILDLLAISVEAGVGLEGAVDVVGQHFDSPLALELNRMLREMELGLPRRAALQHLKRRTEVPEVSNFVLALVQADALGMPMSRVLRIQADEMRSKRRQWAREKAAKLPVKILFPMFVFIFPALFVVVLGPAVMSIAHNLFGK